MVVVGAISLLCILMVNVYWFKIKSILKENNYKTDYVFSHLNDLGNFQHLINSLQDSELKASYKQILLKLKVFIFLTALSIIGVVIYMEVWL